MLIEALRLSEFTLGRPYHAALATLAPREAVGAHIHVDYFEVFYVLGGSGEHHLSTGAQELGRGDLVFVGTEDWHYLAGSSREALQLINVAVPLGYWQAVLDLTQPELAFTLSRESLPKVVKFSGERARMVEASFRRGLERCARGANRFDLLRLIIEVLELVPVGARTERDQRRPEWLVKARRAMDREENLRGGVGRLVELAAVSPAHLARSMRLWYDTTPTALVTELRVRHAEMLLATSSESITVIAARCGFSSVAYFSRCFGQTQGVSPREFRRRARQVVLP